MFQQTTEGIVIKIKVIPKASCTEIVGWVNGELKIRLAALPAKGEANAELVRFLAKTLKIAKSSIQIIQGDTGRSKRICLTGVSLPQVEELLK